MSTVRRLVDSAASCVNGVEPRATEGLDRLCRALVACLEVDGAALTLMGTDGSDGIAAASSQRAQDFLELQFAAGEGPHQEAFGRGRPVLVDDVTRVGTQRWPGFQSLAAEAGLRAILTFPLHVGAARFGVLTAFDSRPRPLAPRELALLLGFVRLATEMVVDLLPGARGGSGSALMDSLDYRAEVYQAQGMVMMKLNVTLQEALARMRAYAFGHGMTLGELATDILQGWPFSEADL